MEDDRGDGVSGEERDAFVCEEKVDLNVQGTTFCRYVYWHTSTLANYFNLGYRQLKVLPQPAGQTLEHHVTYQSQGALLFMLTIQVLRLRDFQTKSCTSFWRFKEKKNSVFRSVKAQICARQTFLCLSLQL